jgi:hypothetical protein
LATKEWLGAVAIEVVGSCVKVDKPAQSNATVRQMHRQVCTEAAATDMLLGNQYLAASDDAFP